MRLGVLDIGSNSAQLQIVDAHPGAPPLPALAVKEPTRLAEEIEEDGAIAEAGVCRAVDAVEAALEAARLHRVEQLFLFATSAIRDAKNRDEIINRIEERTSVRPQFLTGEDEARLTYAAAHRWYGWSAGRLLLLDIGGGSLEIALGRDAEPQLTLSLPLGAGRLTRMFLPDDPPSVKQVKALRRHVRDMLREVADRLRWEGVPARAVATSKTFKQLARLAGAPPQRRGPFVRRALTVEALNAWIPRLAEMKTSERARLRGVSAPRARQILAGAIVAKATMDTLDIRKVDVCPWALREGIMLHHLQTLQVYDGLPLQAISTAVPEVSARGSTGKPLVGLSRGA
ncbi:Ppx/GppA phosphatase family protein [Amycolatopsis thermophila]|uniref:Exopolyphosphatase/guanosine-5'-triphosphate, 3'-diphosphate pyrophosphatase n=1 Tax=Amycolatopsis thermophila TaxID=206084 RepID=A0ABU0ERD7_9PSEU|nr:Ppx/GppA phosphatase family protein [Amycolatopsis thermophila]MDQ0377848.1 exopolyphosphatase/guanosine-5'-triphosphate,3'-diphosphate pyrophosphatase [Amycolatopsis thermophila]